MRTSQRHKQITVFVGVMAILIARVAYSLDSNSQTPVKCKSSGSVGSLSCAYGSSVTSGHVLVVVASTSGSFAITTPIQDTVGSHWNIQTGANSTYLFTASALSSGADTVTVNLTGANAPISMYIYERSSMTQNQDANGPVAGSGKTSSTTAACDSITGTPNLSTAFAFDTIFCVTSGNGGVAGTYSSGPADDGSSPGVSWNDDGHFTGSVTPYLFSTSNSSTVTGTFAASNVVSSSISIDYLGVAFKQIAPTTSATATITPTATATATATNTVTPTATATATQTTTPTTPTTTPTATPTATQTATATSTATATQTATPSATKTPNMIILNYW